jgi:diguanylate cyclase (GGDEF)-like protein/PAS domain S-box-containing protein
MEGGAPLSSRAAIQRAQLEQLVAISPVSVLSSAMLAALLAFMVHYAVSRAVLVAWCAAVLTITLLRVAYSLWLRRLRLRSAAEIRVNLAKFRLGVVLSGTAWGAVSLLFFPAHDPAGQMFTVFIVAGLTAGGLVAYAADTVSGIAFIALVLAPMIARLFFEGGAYLTAMGAAGTVYLVFMVSSVIGLNRHVRDNIRLRLKTEEHERQMQASEEQHRRLLAHLPVGIVHYDAGLAVTYCNAFLADMLKVPVERLLGLDINALPDQTPLPALRQALRGETGYYEGSYHEPFDGRELKVAVTCAPYIGPGGNIQGGIAIVQDISRRLRAEEERKLASMVFENAGEGMLVTDENNRILAVNPAFTEITGYRLEEVTGQNPSIFSSGRHDGDFYRDMWRAINETGRWQGEIWDQRKNGEVYAKLLTINTIRNESGGIHRHVALFSDITERKKSEELIWRQANFDGLTNLPNRQMFYDRLEQETRKQQRTGTPTALLLVDLDHFKEVNDTMGHAVGDHLLVEAARRITRCVRDSDTVSRLGGDEFAIIVAEADDGRGIERIAQELIRSLSQPFQLDEEEAYVSASIGISIYPDDTVELEELFKNADQAMYAAKAAGRNRFSYFTPDMQAAAQNRLRLSNDLHLALTLGQFQVQYQPIVELSSGRIHKAEALLRWKHPRRGMVSPSEFIPLAEETGLIAPIGDWVFREAVRQVEAWRRDYAPGFQVSINTSPAQMRHDDDTHLAWVSWLERQGLPGSAVTVEITEGMLIETRLPVREKLLQFRDAGIQISIDDFGTGYSSLAYLKRFDVDYLKIDQSFVRQLETDASDQALCEAIIVMAHKLDMKVIAEGVETPVQRDLLKRFGCDYGQGFLFAPPLPPHEFEALLNPSRVPSP